MHLYKKKFFRKLTNEYSVPAFICNFDNASPGVTYSIQEFIYKSIILVLQTPPRMVIAFGFFMFKNMGEVSWREHQREPVSCFTSEEYLKIQCLIVIYYFIRQAFGKLVSTVKRVS